jgi:hypothetical protein
MAIHEELDTSRSQSPHPEASMDVEETIDVMLSSTILPDPPFAPPQPQDEQDNPSPYSQTTSLPQLDNGSPMFVANG